VEGRNLVIESRWADGRTERLLDLAAELTRLNADVILVGATATAAAAKSATGTIPIVMASNESTEAPFSPPELWPMRWGVWGHRPKAVECSGAASPRGE
jgi:ABC-type uncharacterized transport system substrate-binding protein